ncbi:MAG: hypothetical protein M1839_005346 [Geoglossum umbratile]|nr:MAG: hypothetical protein M1839_005346 [Geoglossum umbratile]
MPSPQAQPPQLVRITRSDVGGESFILLYVSPTGLPSSTPLDLDLIATEGENPYTGSASLGIIAIGLAHPPQTDDGTGAVRQNKLTKLRAKNYKGGDEEWETILSAALLRQRPEGSGVEAMKGLEIVASVNADDSLIITIRKDIGGIMQRLGNIPMQQDEDAEIQLFQWAGVAARLATVAEDELASLSLRYRSQEETIKKLNEQLEDLIKAKAEHDNAMLEKFVELLNTKKLKIRDQQRLLDAAKTGSSTAIHTQGAGGSTATASRSRKRKAATPESSGDDETGFGKGDTNSEPLDEVENATTPERTDEDETEDEDGDVQLQPRPRAAQPGARKGAGESKGGSRGAATRKRKVSSPPPPRQLPFAKGKALGRGGQARLETNSDGDNDETGESDDDEL